MSEHVSVTKGWLFLLLAAAITLLTTSFVWAQPSSIHVLFTGGVTAHLEPSG